MSTTYAEFLAGKRRIVDDAGRIVDRSEVHSSLFDFQRDIVLWALRKGRAAIFADTGLGKTRMQVEWARPIWPVAAVDQASFEWSNALNDCWYGIRETDVLSTHQARDNDDERHLCPLQLPVIERCVRLWSAPGETILTPFAGIGSELVGALRNGRRAIGVELKPSYFKVAAENCRKAEYESELPSLFDELAL